MKYILLLLFKLVISSFTSNEKETWNYLINAGLTKEGTAGLMGNLKADSSLRSILYDNSYKKKIGWTNQEYVDKVNNGEYSENEFVNDKIGFGIAQWTYYTRKQSLYKKCKGKIGNLKCQLDYLVDELKNNYSEVNELLKSSNNVRDCTVKVLKEFENPKRQDSSVQDFRTKLSYKYYLGLAGSSTINPIPSTSAYQEPKLTQTLEPKTNELTTISEPEITLSIQTYIVQDGDTLYGIATKFNTTIEVLEELNQIENVSLIHPGDVIKLP